MVERQAKLKIDIFTLAWKWAILVIARFMACMKILANAGFSVNLARVVVAVL